MKNLNRNVLNTEVAFGYNAYYQNETGKIIDRLEANSVAIPEKSRRNACLN